MNRLLTLVIFTLSCISISTTSAQEVVRPLSVAVIAPSVSTSMESRRIVAKQKWTVGTLKDADAILVVVRSVLFNPLQATYRSLGKLREDAEGQLNISGPKFHVYIYKMGDNLQCTQLKHISYEAQ